MENSTGNSQKGHLVSLLHAIYQGNRGREKESNPLIDIRFKFSKAAEFLSTIQKYGEVEVKVRVVIDRKIRQTSVQETFNGTVITYVS